MTYDSSVFTWGGGRHVIGTWFDNYRKKKEKISASSKSEGGGGRLTVRLSYFLGKEEIGVNLFGLAG